ncbi:MAG: hypothetical protein ACD_67C00074G0002 [uncultured bacterium]|nr:MAG: hypothetical protein ACD_67C00074G0002 [uncultured bacterium]
MKCPNCWGRDCVDVNIHSDGYASNNPPKECSACGSIWRVLPDGDGTKIDVIKEGEEKLKYDFPDNAANS